jgi:Type II secretion system (T2SS), protein M subtype b
MPLNQNEKKMLTIVGIGTFVFANVLGFTTLFAEQSKVGRDQARLKSRISVLKGWSNQSEEALKVEEFLAGMKTYTDEGQRETYLADLVKGELVEDTGVDVTKFQRLDSKDGEHFDKSRYQATVEGGWTGVMEFIYRLQSPTSFRFVPRIQMVPQKNENNDKEQLVKVTVELEQWWAKPDGAVYIPEKTPAELEQPAAPGVETNTPATETPAAENKPADAVPPPDAPPPGAPATAPADAPPTTPPNP